MKSFWSDQTDQYLRLSFLFAEMSLWLERFRVQTPSCRVSPERSSDPTLLVLSLNRIGPDRLIWKQLSLNFN